MTFIIICLRGWASKFGENMQVMKNEMVSYFMKYATFMCLKDSIWFAIHASFLEMVS